jgi:tripartite-type tricarboxylate transporter receptor subunit TctC
VPPSIVARLNGEIRRILESPEMLERYRGIYLDVKATSPSEFSQMIAADHEKWGRVVQSSGARID